MTKFIYRPISNGKQMGGRRNKSDIKFIVIHYTGNTSRGANADAHYRYLQTASRCGSAHYYVDDNNIIQCIGDTTTAWAVEGRGYRNGQNGCWNSNSISIEMCVNNGYSDKMVFNTVELVKNLLAVYPNARVCRHWDCNRKDCPSGWTGSNNARWNWFLEEIKKPRRILIDLSKTSDCKEVGKVQASKPKPQKKEGQYFVLTSTPGDVLNVREKPSVSSRIVSSYRHGSKIYVHEVVHTADSTWYKIEYHKGKFGYVAARFCKGIK